MSHSHGEVRTVDHHNLLAPVNLIGFAWIEGHRDEGKGVSSATVNLPLAEPKKCGPQSIVRQTDGRRVGASFSFVLSDQFGFTSSKA